jgi:hypothetical protein
MVHLRGRGLAYLIDKIFKYRRGDKKEYKVPTTWCDSADLSLDVEDSPFYYRNR